MEVEMVRLKHELGYAQDCNKGEIYLGDVLAIEEGIERQSKLINSAVDDLFEIQHRYLREVQAAEALKDEAMLKLI
jgi:hypothetical protein